MGAAIMATLRRQLQGLEDGVERAECIVPSGSEFDTLRENVRRIHQAIRDAFDATEQDDERDE